MTRGLWLALCVLGCALTIGCAKGISGMPATPAPSSSPTALPSAACNTAESANPNLILIGVGSEVTTQLSPTYGQIAGYALFDGLDIPDQAQIISA
ncbi:MAG: hypothetical protein ACYC8W_06725, partial [Candidatus Tyrphobacter sp.]